MKANQGIQEKLSDAFSARKDFFANRSSAVFPLYQRLGTDLHIVFLNYWELKSNLKDVACNIRVYNQFGELLLRYRQDIVQYHNQISIRSLLNSRPELNPDFLDGMVEVEIVSSQNIRFSFPGLIGIYQANDHYSMVHSAGRVKNSDELIKFSESEETNWTCKLNYSATNEPEVVPFFHLFNGPIQHDKYQFTVNVRDATGQIFKQSTIEQSMPAFGSRLVRLDEVIDVSDLPADFFVSVIVKADVVYPRLVVGNIFIEHDFLEVTHSFPLTKIKDYCDIDKKKPEQIASFLDAIKGMDLNLNLRVFPTNSSAQVTGELKVMRFDDRALQSDSSKISFGCGVGEKGWEWKMPEELAFASLEFNDTNIPARLNASYRYSVKNTKTLFTTDIATGAKSYVYPPKWRHWGHGIISQAFQTTILFRNNSHAPTLTSANTLKATVYGESFVVEEHYAVGSESALEINLKDMLIKHNISIETTHFVSWMIESQQPYGETYYIAFTKDGRICGEHGF
jgi:hypothetical protein